MISYCKYLPLPIKVLYHIRIGIYRQSVLQSVDGNQERAIDALLGMSDPDYRSEAPPTPAAPQPVALVGCGSYLVQVVMF